LKQVKQILGTLEGGRFVELLVAIFLFGIKRTGDKARFLQDFSMVLPKKLSTLICFL
jgi:hypothetical protein